MLCRPFTLLFEDASASKYMQRKQCSIGYIEQHLRAICEHVSCWLLNVGDSGFN